MDLLLDTCAFLWLAMDPDKFPDKAVAALNNTANRRLLSMVSVLEIVLKVRVGKLPLPCPPEEWIPSRRAYFGIAELPLTESVIFASRKLSPDHPDPFDRLIAAQARILNVPILTADPQMEALGTKVLWG